MASSDKLKILCLHGYRQNADTFRGKTGSLRKILKKFIEPVYITAPNIVKPLVDGSPDDQRGWWFSTVNESFSAKETSNVDPGFQESLSCIAEAVQKHGPFDGILGFSQGASMVGMVCALMEQGDSRFKFDFAIMIAAFRSHSTQHDVCYSRTIQLPCLHVFGDTDQVIPKEMSEEHLQYFENNTQLNHSGGHFVPASSAQKGVYTEFLQIQLRQKEQLANYREDVMMVS
ncbi:esterase OVCA2-like [Apostichopus japonicus]|uniref:esterase OVCA2-like n=1 Tax=Stichopus japonicus TaxID=307972 RepID=UPI003AB733D5